MIVINAEKVVVGGRKSEQKKYYRHSQQPGGLKTEAFQDLQKVCAHSALQGSSANIFDCKSSRLHKARFEYLPVMMCVNLHSMPIHCSSCQPPAMINVSWLSARDSASISASCC